MARVLSSATLLAFLVLLGMAAAIDGPRELPPAGAAAAPAPAGPTKCDAPGRRIYEIKLPDGRYGARCRERSLHRKRGAARQVPHSVPPALLTTSPSLPTSGGNVRLVQHLPAVPASPAERV